MPLFLTVICTQRLPSRPEAKEKLQGHMLCLYILGFRCTVPIHAMLHDNEYLASLTHAPPVKRWKPCMLMCASAQTEVRQKVLGLSAALLQSCSSADTRAQVRPQPSAPAYPACCQAPPCRAQEWCCVF